MLCEMEGRAREIKGSVSRQLVLLPQATWFIWCPLGCISTHILDCGEHKIEHCTFPSVFTLVVLFSSSLFSYKAQTHTCLTGITVVGKKQLNLPRKEGGGPPSQPEASTECEHTSLKVPRVPLEVTEALAIKHTGATTFFPPSKALRAQMRGDGAHLCMPSFFITSRLVERQHLAIVNREQREDPHTVSSVFSFLS